MSKSVHGQTAHPVGCVTQGKQDNIYHSFSNDFLFQKFLINVTMVD
jgi:hypothetical protein